MNVPSNSSVPQLEATVASHIVATARAFPLLYTLVAIILFFIALGQFKTGSNALWSVAYFLDGLLGGSKHTVTLPGPRGLPLVGSLVEVSCPERCIIASSNGFFK